MANYITWTDLPKWARDAITEITGKKRVSEISLHVGEQFDLPPGAYDWSIVYYVARLPDGKVQSFSSSSYDTLIASSPLQRQLYLGGPGTLPPGMQVLRVEKIGRGEALVDFYTHPDTAPFLQSGETPSLNRMEAIVLFAARAYLPRYRKEGIARMLEEAYPGVDRAALNEKYRSAVASLTDRGYLTKAGAITTKGKNALSKVLPGGNVNSGRDFAHLPARAPVHTTAADEIALYLQVPDSGRRHPDPDRAALDQLPDDDPEIVRVVARQAHDLPDVAAMVKAVRDGGKLRERGDRLWVLDRRGQAVGYVDRSGGLNRIVDVPLNRIEVTELGQREDVVQAYSERTTRAPMISAHGPRFPGDTYQLINGHHRYQAAKRRGDKKIRVSASVVTPSGLMVHVPRAGCESGIPDNWARFRYAVEAIAGASKRKKR